MSLVMTVYHKLGTPCAPVALTVDQHRDLIHLAAREEHSGFLRMKNYHADTTYRHTQVDALHAECVQMLTVCPKQMLALLLSIQALIQVAIELVASIEVVSGDGLSVKASELQP